MSREVTRAALTARIADLEEGFPLASLQPLGCGGVADFATVAGSSVALVEAVAAAITVGIPYCVIGSASRVLFSDGGFPGLVVRNQARATAIALDHTQLIVDSGLPFDQAVTLAAGHGLGGLTPWYGSGGTVGGSLVSDPSLASLVRSLTVLMPRSKTKGEPAIVRYQGEWLRSTPELPRYQQLRQSDEPFPRLPVILSAVFQLTRVRDDELRLRLQEQLRIQRDRPQGTDSLGPIFQPIPGADVTELLRLAGAARVRSGAVFPDRYAPNYLRRRGPVRAADVRACIEAMQEAVRDRYGTVLQSRYEYVGVW